MMGFFSRRRRDAELAREMDAHLELEVEENMARGLSPQEARRQAHVKFGSIRRVRESEWENNTLRLIDDAWRDLKYAVRTLAQTPGFTIAAVLVMALGIGANTALFTVVRSVLLKPLPFKDPDRLIQLYEQSLNGKRAYNWVAGGMYAAWKQQAPSVEQMAVFGTDSISLSGDGGPLPERIRYAECEWNLFSLLGVEPALGRGFVAADDRPDAAGTVVLTHSLWMRRYGGNKAILGKTILLDARPYTVIGVLPAWFNYPDLPTQLWAPIYHEKSPAQMRQVDNHNYLVVARLRPGATLAQALSEVDTAEKRVHMETKNPFVGSAASARTLLDGLVHDAKTQLYVLLGATSCVLLIACLNVANLLVARSASRRKETSIRAALGGNRWRLLREQVTESLALAMAGAALGLPLAWAGVRWIVQSRPDMARSVIVSESFARQYFPNEDPVGKHIKALDFQGVPPEGFQVVGVVGNTLWGLTEDEMPTLYFPIYSGGWPNASIAIRSDLDVASLAAPIEKLLAQLDPDLPVSSVLTMEQSIGMSTLDASFTSTLVLAFAVIALVLAAVGLYGVLSYLAAQRTSEIGIRIALGAQRNSVLRLMLPDGLRPAAVGLIVGLVAGAFAVRLIRNLLYGTNPLDWMVFAEVTVVLSLVAALACAVPAWRASRLDPMRALRME